MTVAQLNALPQDQARAELAKCCGAARWCLAMAQRRPFASLAQACLAADEVWASLGPDDWREAFSHHPRIGGKDALRAKFAATRQWSQGEQANVSQAGEDTLEALAQGNQDYERKFGHIFIVCATGKSAEEMLALLRQRLSNDSAAELAIAASEQAKITRIRLQKLLEP